MPGGGRPGRSPRRFPRRSPRAAAWWCAPPPTPRTCPGFSAAGVYDSVTTVRGAGELLDAVRQVWASLLSPRSVRLRHQVGISLDDTYMGVIIQEYVPADLGGVLVTCNPTRREDFRNVYLNCSPGSPETVVDGTTLPQQYLYNTVEGGGRTVALGSSGTDLPAATRGRLADLALTGRLLQSHFSVDDADKPAGHRVADDRSGRLPARPDPPLRAVIRPLPGPWRTARERPSGPPPTPVAPAGSSGSTTASSCCSTCCGGCRCSTPTSGRRDSRTGRSSASRASTTSRSACSRSRPGWWPTASVPETACGPGRS